MKISGGGFHVEGQVLVTQSRVRRKELIVTGIEMMIKYMRINIASKRSSYSSLLLMRIIMNII